MKALFTFLLGVISFLFYTSTLHAEDQCGSICLTLDDAVCNVESTNLTVLLNRYKVEQALRQSQIKRADLLPQVNLAIEQSRRRSIADFGSGNQAFHSNRADSTLQGSLPIIDLPTWATYHSSKLNYRISQLDYEAVLQSILSDVISAYYTHIRNIRRMEVIEANIKRDEVLLELTQLQNKAGTATAIDVTRSEVQLAKDKKERLQQETTLVRSELALKRLLDINMRLPISIECPEYYPEVHPPSFCESLEIALQNRPDYISATKLLERYQYDYKTTNWQYLPKVEASADWGFASKTVLDGSEKQEWLLGLKLTMPVFDGLRIRSQRLENTAIVRQQEQTVKNLYNAIASDVALSNEELDSRYKQIKLTEEQVSLANRELELAKIRFEQGVADNKDLVDAQANLAEVSDQLVNAVFLYNLARIDWARTLGDVRCVLEE